MNPKLDPDTLVTRMQDEAEKEPMKYLDLSKDFEIQIMSQIEEAKELGVILSEDGAWKWGADGGSVFQHIPKGVAPNKALIQYFATESGEKVYHTIVQQLKSKKESMVKEEVN